MITILNRVMIYIYISRHMIISNFIEKLLLHMFVVNRINLKVKLSNLPIDKSLEFLFLDNVSLCSFTAVKPVEELPQSSKYGKVEHNRFIQ